MNKNLRAGILFLTMMSIWGIIYPQYALTEDMYAVTGNGGKVGTKDSGKDFMRILTAEKGEVKLRFRALDKIEELIGEKETDGYGGK